ncbi:hypothetical protein LCGC14_2389320 [marine sediment metagenome]|uniref:Uncharacterized protein n=1 Tax=marine sediment metagenome TaxID=412755 RepID=A0A0F9ET56_9ZZZZ
MPGYLHRTTYGEVTGAVSRLTKASTPSSKNGKSYSRSPPFVELAIGLYGRPKSVQRFLNLLRGRGRDSRAQNRQETEQGQTKCILRYQLTEIYQSLLDRRRVAKQFTHNLSGAWPTLCCKCATISASQICEVKNLKPNTR